MSSERKRGKEMKKIKCLRCKSEKNIKSRIEEIGKEHQMSFNVSYASNNSYTLFSITHTHTISLSHTQTHILSFSLSLSYTQIIYITHTLTVSLSHNLSLSLSHTHTRTLYLFAVYDTIFTMGILFLFLLAKS